MKKLFVSLTTFILTIFIYMNIVNANGFEMKIESDKDIIKPGETILLTVSINNIETDNEGIDLLLASISYDNNVPINGILFPIPLIEPLNCAQNFERPVFPALSASLPPTLQP